MRRLAFTALLLFPAIALAEQPCAFQAPRNLDLDLAGVRTVQVDVRSHNLHVKGLADAKRLSLPRFSIGMLTTAESNIKMGTAYFADLVKQFGGLHFALATYNAGPSRIARWIAAKPGLERDEFIDDIPFPETQNYVKRILGTAEDYRRLYGPEGSADATDAIPAVAEVPASGAKASAAAAAAASKSASAKKKAAPAPVKKKKAAPRSKKAA